jgi:sugar/nucleoside kinase (ribokinase family)
MQAAPPVDALCAGIVVADHVCTPIPRMPGPGEVVTADRLLLTLGGCAANTAVDLAKMGVRSAVAGRVGDDLLGRVVAGMLADAHVDTSALKAVAGADTSQTLIVNVAGQDRRYIHSFGANAGYRAADIPVSGRVLYVGGFFLMADLSGADLAGVFKSAHARGTRTFLDVVTPPDVDYLGQLKPVLPHVDVFKCNSDEARLITGIVDVREQADCLRGLGAATVIVSMGGDGAFLANGRGRWRAAAFPIEFVDASGSGDAFDAGYISGMLNDLSVEDCLRYASALGASCVRAIGTTPGVFTRDECEAFLREHQLKIERLSC